MAVAVAVALASTFGSAWRRDTGARGATRFEAAAAIRPDSAPDLGEPEILAGEHAVTGALWRPDGHLLVMTPSDLVDVDPDAPLPARRLPISAARRLHPSAAGTFLVEKVDGWETWEASTLTRLAEGTAHERIALSPDGRFLAAPSCDDDAGGCHFVVLDVATGLPRATMPVGNGTFSFVPGGMPGSAWATVVSGDELTLLDAQSGAVSLRRKLRRLTENGQSRELLEIRGKRAYLTSAYGFEVFDLGRGVTLVRLPDPRPLEEATFTISDDGTTVTEASTYAETSVDTWDVPPGANAARRADALPARAAAGDSATSPDGRYFASWAHGSLTVVSLRSGGIALQLGPPAEPPVDMFRQLVLEGGAPRLRDRHRQGSEIVLARDEAPGSAASGATDAGLDPATVPPAGDDLVLAAADARFAYFLGTEHADRPVTPLLPVLRVDRQTGATVPLFAAQRSAIAELPGHAIEIFGDEEEARRSIVCATDTSWRSVASCLNVFLVEGRF
jgi:hypothetical protein